MKCIPSLIGLLASKNSHWNTYIHIYGPSPLQIRRDMSAYASSKISRLPSFAMVPRALYRGEKRPIYYKRGKPPLLAFCPASQGQCRISLKDDDITALWQNMCPTYGVKRPIFYFCSTLRTYKNNLLLLLEKHDSAKTNKQNTRIYVGSGLDVKANYESCP